jgi:general secretion pathway protein G
MPRLEPSLQNTRPRTRQSPGRFVYVFTMTPRLPVSRRRGMVRSRRAFTLLEILVVLAILGLLATLAISNLDNLFGGARKDTAEMFVKQSLRVPLQAYQLNMGTYPSTAEGLNALLTPPANKAGSWRGPYVKEDGGIPLDPWKQPYQYRFPGVKNKNGYDLWSKGPDEQDGTADDIGNWATTTEAGK